MLNGDGESLSRDIRWASSVFTGYPGFQAATYTSRTYAGITPGYTYQFPGKSPTLPVHSCSV